MKKTNTTTGAAASPAPKKSAAAKSAAKSVAAAKPVEVAKPVAEVAKPVVEASKPVAQVKRSKPSGTVPTVIQANIDVGFGNSLFVRGEGPGLSWDRGVAMDCVQNDLWSFTVGAAAKPIIFKFLINDETWCAGDDYAVEPGNRITLVPML